MSWIAAVLTSDICRDEFRSTAETMRLLNDSMNIL